MKKLLVLLGVISPGFSAVIECSLELSHVDDLLTIPVDQSNLYLILDTGAAGAVFFDPNSGETGTSSIAFQQARIARIRPHGKAALACSPSVQLLESPVSGRPNPEDLMKVADGIVGLGGRGFGNPSSSFLYADHAPKWSTVSITVPSKQKLNGGNMKIFSRSFRTTIGQTVPVISDYYWAAGAEITGTV